MKRFLSNIISVLVIVIAIMLIVSGIMGHDYPQLEYKPERMMRPNSKRMQNIAYSLPLIDTVSHNWLPVYKELFDDSKQYLAGVLPVDNEIYFPLKLQSAPGDEVARNRHNSTVSYSSFDVTFMNVLDAGLGLHEKRLRKLMRYYIARRLLFSDVTALDAGSVHYHHDFHLNYASKDERTVKAIQSQLKVAEIVLKDNQLPWRDLVLEAGYVDLDTSAQDWQNRQLIDEALGQTARNIFDALKAWSDKSELNAEDANDRKMVPVRILLRNSLQPEAGRRRYYLGQNYRELLDLRRRIINLNNTIYPRIEDLEERVGLSIETSRLLYAYDHYPYSFAAEYGGDAPDENRTVADLVKRLNEDLVDRDYKGDITRRFVNQVTLSYVRSRTEERGIDWVNLFEQQKELQGKSNAKPRRPYLTDPANMYLPYTRASRKSFLKEQLRLAAGLVEISSIGLSSRGVVHFRLPRRENFPFMHTMLRPVAESRYLYSIFVMKKNGASVEEQQKSIDWVNHYLYSTVP